MNTPKLSSLFPSPASSDLSARTGRAASPPGMAFAEVLGERAQSRSAANVAPRREVNTPSEQPTAPSSPAPQQDRATAPTDSGAVASNDSAPSASEAATSTSKPIEAATDA